MQWTEAKAKLLKDGQVEYLGSLKAVAGGGVVTSERFPTKCDIYVEQIALLFTNIMIALFSEGFPTLTPKNG